jgi:hypothetical protein
MSARGMAIGADAVCPTLPLRLIPCLERAPAGAALQRRRVGFQPA